MGFIIGTPLKSCHLKFVSTLAFLALAYYGQLYTLPENLGVFDDNSRIFFYFLIKTCCGY